jgi:ATP-dependent helicase HrpA
MIGCTQPRRIAARAVAARGVAELHSPLGDVVGYQVRFTDKVSEDSRIKFMTDGILLADRQDRWLSRYDTIIVDEARTQPQHRFPAGYLKQLLASADLKLIVTSATIDTERAPSISTMRRWSTSKAAPIR